MEKEAREKAKKQFNAVTSLGAMAVGFYMTSAGFLISFGAFIMLQITAKVIWDLDDAFSRSKEEK